MRAAGAGCTLDPSLLFPSLRMLPPAGPAQPGRKGSSSGHGEHAAHSVDRSGTRWGRQLGPESVPRPGAGGTARVCGCRGPPSPLAHCRPRSHGPPSSGHRKCHPSRLEPPRTHATLPNCPERESEHSCFLWSPPGWPRSPHGPPAAPGSQGVRGRALHLAWALQGRPRAPGSSRTARP